MHIVCIIHRNKGKAKKILCHDHLRLLGNYGDSVYFWDINRRLSLLSSVYARESKISYKGGGGVKCVTGHGLHIQPGQLWLHDTDQ